MDVANASMYDGASALAEAALMASSITGRTEWVVSSCVHPAYRDTMRTYAWASGCSVVEAERTGLLTDITSISGLVTEKTACIIMQTPNFFGAIESLPSMESIAHRNNAIFITCYDPISLGMLKPPGDFNVDICVGEGQSMGIQTEFGGPLLGLFACKREYVRHMPGRLVGVTTDTKNQRAYTLTLQTREQHIRRERATSNICTNQALCALAASVYLTTLGRQGMLHIANLCLQKAHYAADRISALDGYSLPFRSQFFKEFVIKTAIPISEINKRLLDNKIIGGLDLGRSYPELENHMMICVTELRTKEEIDFLAEVLAQ